MTVIFQCTWPIMTFSFYLLYHHYKPIPHVVVSFTSCWITDTLMKMFKFCQHNFYHKTNQTYCKSPHNWLVRLAMDLPLCVICGVENGTNWCNLIYTEDLLATSWLPTPPPLHPYRSACGIGVACNNLSKMAGNSASHSFNYLCIDRLWIAIELWQIVCKHLFSFLRYNNSNNKNQQF